MTSVEEGKGQEDAPFRVAIVGGGIAGACAASTLLSSSPSRGVRVDLFDQGRRGPGGRASHRRAVANAANGDHAQLRFDHGAQFFRADTPRFREKVMEWIERGFVKEWEGTFTSDVREEEDASEAEQRGFFGMPSRPPFYVGADGMSSVINGVLNGCGAGDVRLKVFKGTRVADMERAPNGKWILYGTSGEVAYHDTPEAKVRAAQSNGKMRLGRSDEAAYDVVILTDVSSSFGAWHRASAGVPESFAAKVRPRVGARVPLMTAMVAFDSRLEVPFDAASFSNHEVLWFAARSASKPGMATEKVDCWTIVSTPEYAMEKIEETPMQDPVTGAFIPQFPSYLTSVPGPDLEGAFRKAVTDPNGILGKSALDVDTLPKTVYLDAQRWGSALSCHRHLDDKSATRRVISGVPYDGARASLAPTKEERRMGSGREDDGANFLSDDELGLLQAGDMMSKYAPGFEAAALSGMDAAGHALQFLDAEN